MLIVGITGCMGCGKSTVSRMLETVGSQRLDADQLARKAIEPNQPGYQQVIKRFGTEILDTGGNILRPRLAQAALADESSLADLEAIIHPQVAHLQKTWLASLPDNIAVAVMEVPLLFETQGHRRCDLTVAVACGPHGEGRISQRNGGAPLSEVVKRMIARQLPESEKCALAHHVIQNDGSLDNTWQQVELLWKNLKSRPGNAWPKRWQ